VGARREYALLNFAPVLTFLLPQTTPSASHLPKNKKVTFCSNSASTMMKLSFSLLTLALCTGVNEAFTVLPQQKSMSRTTMLATAATHDTLTISPIKSLDGTVTLPGSKSLSNRCLLLAALSEGKTRVDNLLDSDDIK
jgi:hypothetical protein